MVVDIIFHNSQDNHAEGAFILKTTLKTVAVLSRLKIGIGA
jgi:hypothetical protein